MDREIDFTDLLQKTHAEQADAANDLCDLANVVDSEKLFTALFAHLCLSLAETANELTHSDSPAKLELLAFHLFPSFGSGSKRDPDARDVMRGLSSLDVLFKCNQRAEMYESILETKKLDPEKRALASLIHAVRTDAQIVRGCAYPEQTAKEICECFGPFDAWFQKQIGLAPTRAVDLIFAIVRSTEEAATARAPEILDSAQSLRQRFSIARHRLKRRQATEDDRNLLSTFQSASAASNFGFISRLTEIAPACIPVARTSIDLSPPLLRQSGRPCVSSSDAQKIIAPA
jgi:hypothetical protein